MTQILPAASQKAFKLARRLLREGEVVAFPTDTLYGVGAVAFEPYAVRQIFKVKNRPADKAIPVFITQIDDLSQVAKHVPNAAWPLLQKFWPGALTVVLPKVAALPADVTAGQNTVAVRIPDHPMSLELVRQVGRPLAVTSANLSGHANPASAQDVAEQLAGRLPLILDGGPSPSAQASTIIDLSVSPPRVLRTGPISVEQLRDYLPDLIG